MTRVFSMFRLCIIWYNVKLMLLILMNLSVLLYSKMSLIGIVAVIAECLQHVMLVDFRFQIAELKQVDMNSVEAE